MRSSQAKSSKPSGNDPTSILKPESTIQHQTLCTLRQTNIEGVRHPKFGVKQAAAGSQGSGGRLNLLYSAVEEVVVEVNTNHRTEGHPV